MSSWISLLVVASVAIPALAFMLLAVTAWFVRSVPERAVVRVVAGAFAGSALAIAAAGAEMLRTGRHDVRVQLGHWFIADGYQFALEFSLDLLSLPFAELAAVLLGLIAAFSARYLHRERGFARFYLLLVLFGVSMLLAAFGGSFEIILFGWELVGICSALLIAFFDDRTAPVRHGFRAYVTYRFCDMGLLAAGVWLHHTVSTGALSVGTGAPWACLSVPTSAVDTTAVGLLLCWAAMGKAAQVPLGGWLPRAMEGPTPSSAVFYGALSVHLGPYLLLRAAPILERAPLASAAVVFVGACTAIHASFVGRVQTDIKCALAYASMTQVGLIFVEVGLGLHTIAVVHIVGHACIRTLQLLRAPSLLHEHHHLEQALGAHLPRTGRHIERLVPAGLQPWLYRLALERGYFDALLSERIIGSAVRFLRGVDRLEERWTGLLQHGAHTMGRRSEVTR